MLLVQIPEDETEVSEYKSGYWADSLKLTMLLKCDKIHVLHMFDIIHSN